MIEAIEKLKKMEGANFSEVCEKHVFECYRVRSDGCMQEVSVVVLDAGPAAAAQARYFCYARSEEGRQASSRLESTLDAAFASIRWSDLEPEAAQERHTPIAGDVDAQARPQTRVEYERRDLFDRLKRRLVQKAKD